MVMNDDLKRSIILEHYEKPLNRGLVNDKNYLKVNVKNESCLDDLTLMVKLEGDMISDLRFDGEACAISMSATSIMIKLVLKQRKAVALRILREYEKMINEEPYNQDLIGLAVVYNKVYLQPNRKQCALLPWIALKKILGDDK